MWGLGGCVGGWGLLVECVGWVGVGWVFSLGGCVYWLLCVCRCCGWFGMWFLVELGMGQEEGG
jgi:hypothetical protein